MKLSSDLLEMLRKLAEKAAACDDDEFNAMEWSGENYDETGRVAVTAEEYAKSEINGEEYAYWLDEEAERWGMDGWALIDGVDLMTDPDSYECDVWFASGKCKTVPVTTPIFVLAKHAIHFS